MTNEKYFPKTPSQYEIGYGLFINLPKTSAVWGFNFVSNQKEFQTLKFLVAMKKKMIANLRPVSTAFKC